MANDYNELEQLVNDVTSLDTARMTLRWALERLNNIEKEKADLKKNLTIAEETSKKLQLKDASLTDAYSSRTKTLEEKEDFYTKLEATMSLLGEGKLDIQQLLKKEAKLDSLRKSLEDEYQDKFGELDRNQRAVIERWNARLLEVESQYAGRLAEAQQKYDVLRSELESGYQGRLTSLQGSFRTREKELSERINSLEASVHLSEEKVETRRRELEADYLVKKHENEENYRKLRAMLEGGLEEKLRSMDSDHAAQVRSLETSWQTERARLLDEQRLRDDQFISAQARIKEIENKLAAQQETHHGELLKLISEKETAFRAQLAALEKEKAAKEETVKQLVAKLEKKASDWEAEKARLEAEFGGRLALMEQGVRERAAALEREYSGKKEELENIIAVNREETEKGFNACLLRERQAMEEEKTRLVAERRQKEESLARASEKVKELENALSSNHEEHHKELMDRIRSGEMAFRGKLEAFEGEKRSYNETINKLTDDVRARDRVLLEEKNKIAEEFGAKARIYEERIALMDASFGERRNEYEKKIGELSAGMSAAFEEKRSGYEERISELSGRLDEAAKVSALEKENFKNEVARISAETAALAEERAAAVRADYEARKAALEKEFDARAVVYEARLASVSARLEEAARASALEKERFENDLARISAESAAAADERTAAVRADYEARKAELGKEFEARYGDALRALEAEKGRMAIALEASENRAEETRACGKKLEAALAGRAAELEREYAARRERLESDLRDRTAAVYAEAEVKMDFERKNWQYERSMLENQVSEISGNFRSAQKEIETLNSGLRKSAEVSAATETAFNRELMEAKANYDRELTYRVKDAVTVQTAHLVEALEAARARQEETAAALAEKENSINALRGEAVEARRDCEERVRSASSGAVAARRAELEEDYRARRAALAEEFALKNDRLAGENETLRENIGKISAVAAEANTRAAALAGKLLEAEKAAAAEKLEMQKAQVRELDSAVADAVAAAVDALQQKLAHAHAEMDKALADGRDEVKHLEEIFAAEKDRMLEEMDRRERYIESADIKIQDLEREMMKYRQSASGELMRQVAEQDARFRTVVGEEKARSEARVKQLEDLLTAKEKLLADGDKFYRQKQMELDAMQSDLNQRVNKFNTELFAQKQELSEKEKGLNEYRLGLEKDHASRTSELEKMKAELTRVIMDYKGRK